MERVALQIEEPYEVLIGHGLLSELGERLLKVHRPCRTMLIADKTVYALYGKQAESALKSAGFSVYTFQFPAGEQSKTMDTCMRALSKMAQAEITRADLVLTLGGGVAGDLGGFAAAIYQRGIPFVQLPTTLLSAIDASVGGKTAVDLPEGKNLAGAFHQPSLILCDTATLDTLPNEIFMQGAAEIIKHGLLTNAAWLSEFAASPKANIDEIIRKNVEIKASFVLHDERDTSRRQMLNLGHTIGHALEKLSNYALSHGQAVAIGLVAELRAARKMGFGSVDERIAQKYISQCGLQTEYACDADAMLALAVRDKKRRGETINMIILTENGPQLKALSMDDFKRFAALGLQP